MKNVNIRQCSDMDIESVHFLQVCWAEERITHGFQAASLEALSERIGPYFLVVDSDQEIVGFITGSEHTSEGLAVIPAGQRYLEIDDLYVTPERRNEGIGARLLGAIEEVASGAGIERFLVYSATKDLDRISKFYREQGFTPWYVQLFK